MCACIHTHTSCVPGNNARDFVSVLSHIFSRLIWCTDWCACAWNFFLSYGCWKLLDGLINKCYFVLFSTVLLDFNPCNVCIHIFVALIMTFLLSPVIEIVLLNLCVLLSRGTKSYFVFTLWNKFRLFFYSCCSAWFDSNMSLPENKLSLF